MFYLEGVNELKFRNVKTKEKSKKIVQTIKPNFSSLDADRESEQGYQAAEVILSKEGQKEVKEHPNPNQSVLKLTKTPLETKYYLVSENVENKINNLYDQINYLSIDLKKE